MAIAWLAGRLVPWPVLGGAGPVLGMLALLAGLVLTGLALWEMRAARTTVIPRARPAALVTSGVFRLSRNPIYLADLLFFIAAVLWFQALWLAPMVVVLGWVLQARFITGEEAILRNDFGPSFLAWSSGVGRWIGPL